MRVRHKRNQKVVNVGGMRQTKFSHQNARTRFDSSEAAISDLTFAPPTHFANANRAPRLLSKHQHRTERVRIFVNGKLTRRRYTSRRFL